MDMKSEDEKEFNLPPLGQMNDFVLDIAIKYAKKGLNTLKGDESAVDLFNRQKRKLKLLLDEKERRGSGEGR